MFELSSSRYLVPAFLLIAVPSLCDASVAKHDDIVPIYPIFPVSLPTSSVDSGLLPRIYPVYLFPQPPSFPQCSGLTLLRVSFTPRRLNVKHVYINFNRYFTSTLTV